LKFSMLIDMPKYFVLKDSSFEMTLAKAEKILNNDFEYCNFKKFPNFSPTLHLKVDILICFQARYVCSM